MSKIVPSQEQTPRANYFARGRHLAVSTVADRLRQAMDLRGVDQSALARSIGVTQGAISLILLGKTRHSKYLPAIAIELNVAYEWLIGRAEDMEGDAPIEHLLTPDELSMIEQIRNLPSLDRLAVRRVVNGVASLASPAHGSASLPPEAALVQMFKALLAGIDPKASQDEQALLLAQRLPIGLSQLRDLLPDSATAMPHRQGRPAADAARAMPHPEPTR